MRSADPHHAPEYLVAQVAATYPTPRPHPAVCSREDAHRAHLAQARELADRIWAEAFSAGATYGLSIQMPSPVLVINEPIQQLIERGTT